MLLTAIVSLSAAPVVACPVCFGSAPPRVVDAYLLSTLLLSLLPLVILAVLGGCVYVAFLGPRAARAQSEPPRRSVAGD